LGEGRGVGRMTLSQQGHAYISKGKWGFERERQQKEKEKEKESDEKGYCYVSHLTKVCVSFRNLGL